MDAAPTADAPARLRLAPVLLGLSMFLTGASGFVFECILSTVATYLLGNSIEQFSVTISLMMLMMGVASFVQRHWNDDYLVEKFLVVETLLALLGGFAPLAVYGAYAYAETHFLLIQYGFIIAIGFLIGLEIPLVLRMNRVFVEQLKTNVAVVLSPDYIGAFLGAVLWVYVLLKHFPLTEISFLVAAVNFAVAALTYGYFAANGQVRRGWLSLAMVIVTAAALGFGFARNRDWNTLFEQRLYDAPIVFSQTSKYQHLVMTARSNPVEYRLFINGNLQFSSKDERRYHELLVHPPMTLAPTHRRVLILGGGDGLGLREVLRYRAAEQVTLVDLDPAIIQLATDDPVVSELNENAFADARVQATGAPIEGTGDLRTVWQYTGAREEDRQLERVPIATVDVYTVDADRFLEDVATAEPWDVVIIDFPDPNSIELVKLYSREFYTKVRRILAPDGLIAVQSTSPYHAKESFLCILRTLGGAGFETIPYHANVPSFGDWGWVLAWTGEPTESQLRERISTLETLGPADAKLTYLTPEVLRAATVFGHDELSAQHAEVNTLMRPVLLQYYLDESWIE